MENSELIISYDQAIVILMLEYELPEAEAREAIARNTHQWTTAFLESTVRVWGEQERKFQKLLVSADTPQADVQQARRRKV